MTSKGNVTSLCKDKNLCIIYDIDKGKKPLWDHNNVGFQTGRHKQNKSLHEQQHGFFRDDTQRKLLQTSS